MRRPHRENSKSEARNRNKYGIRYPIVAHEAFAELRVETLLAVASDDNAIPNPVRLESDGKYQVAERPQCSYEREKQVFWCHEFALFQMTRE